MRPKYFTTLKKFLIFILFQKVISVKVSTDKIDGSSLREILDSEGKLLGHWLNCTDNTTYRKEKNSNEQNNSCDLVSFPNTTDTTITLQLKSALEKEACICFFKSSSEVNLSGTCHHNSNVSHCEEIATDNKIIDHLEPDTEYTLCLQTIIKNNTSFICTNEKTEQEPGRTRDLSLKAINSSAIRITWYQDGHADGFKIVVSSTESVREFHITDSVTNELIVDGLNNTVTYEVRIQTYVLQRNGRLYGRQSVREVRIGLIVEEVKLIRLAKDNIEVTWKQPLNDTFEYLVEWCLKDSCHNETTNTTEAIIRESQLHNITITPYVNLGNETIYQTPFTKELNSESFTSENKDSNLKESSGSKSVTAVLLSFLLVSVLAGIAYFIFSRRKKRKQSEQFQKMFMDPDEEDVVYVKRGILENQQHRYTVPLNEQ